MSKLPPPRLLVTGHSPSGSSIITSDSHVEPFHPFGSSKSGFSHFHSASSLPLDNTLGLPSTPPASTNAGGIPRVQPTGVVFCAADIPPGAAAPMHRTQSCDYACVLNGEIVMELDGGEKTVIKAGDCVLQRGAMHLWRNEGDVTCRILFVMVGSEKVKVEETGEELEAYIPLPPGGKEGTGESDE